MTDKAVNAMHKLLERIHDMLQDGKGEGWESFNRMRWFEMGVPIMWLMDNHPNGKVMYCNEKSVNMVATYAYVSIMIIGRNSCQHTQIIERPRRRLEKLFQGQPVS